jgi:hypothetical protein
MIWSASAQAAGLTKIERHLAKEPVYRGQPKYCLLVFGPEAKTKVWLVVDGDTFYVDRNGNGDLTDKDERVDLPLFERPPSPSLIAGQRAGKAGNIQDGRLSHTELEVTQVRLDLDYKPKDRDEEKFKRFASPVPDGILYSVSLSVEMGSGRGRVKFTALADTQGFLGFAGSPKNAPVIHFDGPLQIGLQPMQNLLRGGKPTELHCWVGTPGLGAGTLAVLEYTSKPGFVPDDCQPSAEIEFPGTKAARLKVVLKDRC